MSNLQVGSLQRQVAFFILLLFFVVVVVELIKTIFFVSLSWLKSVQSNKESIVGMVTGDQGTRVLLRCQAASLQAQQLPAVGRLTQGNGEQCPRPVQQTTGYNQILPARPHHQVRTK